jgi:hypothetical protein
VEGGKICGDGKETLRGISYNAVFASSAKAIRELHEIVKLQQMGIEELNTNIC